MSSTHLTGSPVDGPVLGPMPGPATRSDLVYDELKKAILSRRLRAGTLYTVAALAEQLQVSRTPVREALLQLAREGMVRLERSRGFGIVEPPAREVQDIFAIRRLLEPWAARRAVENMHESALVAQQLRERLRGAFEGMLDAVRKNDERQFWRHDRDFHLAILEASGNERLAVMVDGLRDLMLLRDATIAALGSGEFVHVAEEHRPIVEAIEAGDEARAEEAMLEHVKGAGERVQRSEQRRGQLPD